jgi:hypothetical protein
MLLGTYDLTSNKARQTTRNGLDRSNALHFQAGGSEHGCSVLYGGADRQHLVQPIKGDFHGSLIGGAKLAGLFGWTS